MAGPSDRGGTHPQGTRFPEGSQQSGGSTGTHSGTSRVGDVLGQVKEGAQHLASEASRQAGQAWEATKEGASAVADRAQDFWSGTQDLIRRYPIASVAIAFGAGCLFAGLFAGGTAFAWGESMPERMSRYSA
jgi:ElaB/YqjD/DUF883 family membrane-anchored ribosome-binding protein